MYLLGSSLVQDFGTVYKIFYLWDALGIPPLSDNISEMELDWGQLYDDVSRTAEETFQFVRTKIKQMFNKVKKQMYHV